MGNSVSTSRSDLPEDEKQPSQPAHERKNESEQSTADKSSKSNENRAGAGLEDGEGEESVKRKPHASHIQEVEQQIPKPEEQIHEESTEIQNTPDPVHINMLFLGLIGSGKSTLGHSLLRSTTTLEKINDGVRPKKFDELISEEKGLCCGYITIKTIDTNGFENDYRDRKMEIIGLSKKLKKYEIDVIVICVDVTSRLDVDTLVDSLMLLASCASKPKEFWERAVIALTYSNLAKCKWQHESESSLEKKFIESAKSIHECIFAKIAVTKREVKDSKIPYVCVGRRLHSDEDFSIHPITKDWVEDFLNVCESIAPLEKKKIWDKIILSYSLMFGFQNMKNSLRAQTLREQDKAEGDLKNTGVFDSTC